MSRIETEGLFLCEKIKGEKSPRAIAIEENYSLKKAFEADELRKERHEFSRAKRVRDANEERCERLSRSRGRTS